MASLDDCIQTSSSPDSSQTILSPTPLHRTPDSAPLTPKRASFASSRSVDALDSIRPTPCSAQQVCEACKRSHSRGNPIDRACGDVILHAATFLDAKSLTYAGSVNRRWRALVLAHDEYLWRPHCRNFWSGRQLLNPNFTPFVRALQCDCGAQIELEPSNAALGLTSEATSSRIVAMLRAKRLEAYRKSLISTWSKALRASVQDSTRTGLLSEELRHGEWQLSLLNEDVEPSTVTFNTETNTLAVENLPQVPYELFDGGHSLQIHVYPTLNITRSPATWSWCLQNKFVSIESVGPTAPGDSFQQTVATTTATTAEITTIDIPVEVEEFVDVTTKTLDAAALAALLFSTNPKNGPKVSRRHGGRHYSVQDLLLSGLKRLHLSQDSTFLTLFGERLGARKHEQGPRCAEYLRMCGHPSKPP